MRIPIFRVRNRGRNRVRNGVRNRDELGTNISIRDICTDWNPSVESIYNPTV